MASFEELYPSMAKRLNQSQPAHEFQVIEDLPEDSDSVHVRISPSQEPELVDLGGRPTTQDLADQWMTVKEAAEAMGMVTETIYRYIKRGDLASIRLGPRKIRVLKADVHKMLTLKEK